MFQGIRRPKKREKDRGMVSCSVEQSEPKQDLLVKFAISYRCSSQCPEIIIIVTSKITDQETFRMVEE